MTRPVRAWAGCRARGRTGSLISRLPRVTFSVVLLCALVPAVASARSERRSHAHRHAVHKVQTSLQTSARAARSRVADLQLGSGERSRHGSVAVRRLQRGLRRAGYAPGPVDGRYGPLTTAAVEQFQANHALRVDGIVGPATRHTLRAAPVLSLGAGEGSVHGSPAVAYLQRQLTRAGFRPGPVDGRFGPRTEHALLAFQRSRHVATDGIAGPVTGRALQSVGRVSRRPTGPKGKAAPSRPAPVKHGSHHNATPNPNPNPNPRPRPAQVQGPRTPHLPMGWILIGLGVIGLTTLLTGYFQRPIRSRAARLTQGVSAIRKGGAAPKGRPATPDALPEPEPAPVRFLLYEDNSGGYYWTIVSDGGQVLARSAVFASYEEA
ncbi:MAG TPA: peptidoglycan-binding protein, partial [Solirubrobacteraceae bacterium]